MFGKRITLFRLLGFSVHLDLSWLIIATLVTWSLAAGVFPHYFDGLDPSTYWLMGALGMVGLFVSIVAHELAHSLVARRHGLQIRGITLFIFGGVAEMDEEPSTAKSELLMALAGPGLSVMLGLSIFGAYAASSASGWPVPVLGVLGYLAWMNVILAAFNMVPAFPLDGGRVLRSVLWWWKGDLRWATRIAAGFGSAFGFLLVFLGIVQFIRGAFISGIWWVFIGLFIRNASQVSYHRVITRRLLEGEPVSRFMESDPVTVPPDLSVTRFVEDYLVRYDYKVFPVVRGDRLEGCLTTREVKELPREEWADHTVLSISRACGRSTVITPQADALDALARMSGSDNSRLLVCEGERLAGIVTLRDLMRYLAVKLDLDEDEVRHTAGILPPPGL